MSRALVYPWIYLTQLLSWLVLFGSIFFVMSFVLAIPIAELDLSGKSLPAHWEAAYLDHGAYLRGYLISKNPVLFALCAAVLISTLAAQGLIRGEVNRQIYAGGEPRARADKIARGISVIAGLVFITLAYKFLVVRAIPA